jgi:hypothetical protein
MLRSPRAIALFCAIAFVPVVLFLGAWWLFWLLVEADALLARRGPILLLSLGAVLLFLAAQHFAFVQAMNRTYGPFVRIALRARGTPVCLNCGQLLAATAARCPECGAEEARRSPAGAPAAEGDREAAPTQGAG